MTEQWTVISLDEETGQVLADIVLADDEWDAFGKVLDLRYEIASLITFVGAIKGGHAVYTPTESGVGCAAIDYPDPRLDTSKP